MKFRIVKTEIYDKEAFVPQFKPCLLIQVLQLNFEWRNFHNTTVKESDRCIRYFRKIEHAVKFIESGVYKDTFGSQVVWQDGKAVNDERT